MTTPLTEEQREKLLQLQSRNANQSFNVGVQDEFMPQQTASSMPAILPETTQDAFESTTEPEIAPIIDDSPLVEDVGATVPAVGGAGTDTLVGGVGTEPLQPPQPILPESDTIAPIEPETASDVAPSEPFSPEPTPKPGGMGFESLQQQAGDVFGQHKAAVTQLGQLEADEAAEKAPLLEKKSKSLEDHNTKLKKIMDESTAGIKADTDARNAKIDEFDKMEYKGFWQNKSTGEKILGALAVALGAYAQGLSGGKLPNTALTIINKAVEEDFKQFKVKQGKLLKAIQQSGVSIQMKRQATQDLLNGEDAYSVGQLGQIESQLGEITNKFKSPKAKEQANILISKIGQNKLSLEANLQAKLEAKYARDAQIAINKEKVKFAGEANKLKKQELQQKENDKLYVPGVGRALTANDAKILKDSTVAKKALDSKLDEMIALRDKHEGGEMWDREDVARGKQLSKEVLLQYKTLAGLGVLSQSDMDIVETIIPADPLQYEFMPGQDPTLENLKKFRKSTDEDYQAQVSARLKTPESTVETKTVNGIKYQKVQGGWKRVK